MSVVTKSTVIYSERQGATYKQNDEIEMYIPPSLQLLNTKETYLRFNVKMEGLLKKSVSKSAGPAGLFETITVMSGDGSTIYESLDSYGLKAALYNHYSKIPGNHLKELHEGLPNTTLLTGKAGNQYCDGNISSATSGNADAHKNVEICLPLWCVGCLTPLRDKIFPLIATGGLRLRFRLASVKRATQVMSLPVYKAATGAKPVKSPYERLQGGYQGGYSMPMDTAGANTILKLVKGNANVLASFNGEWAGLCPHITNGDILPGSSHPFVVGQTVNIGAGVAGVAIGDRTITAVAENGGQLEVTVSGGAIAAATGRQVYIKTDDTSNPNENYAITNFTMVVSYAVANPQYLEALAGAVKSGKFNIDIDTWTDYSQNIGADSKQNSLYIKSVNNRAKAIISIPIKTAGDSFIEDSYMPDTQNADSYQFLLYGLLVPNKSIKVNRFQLGTSGQEFESASANGDALKEMSHALSAAGYPVNNLYAPWRHFFIGRKLANKGYSMNLNQEGDVRLQVNYDSSAGPVSTLVHNIVSHIRRINISGSNQSVSL
tara:strand:- start:954 stop:2591 length:1638 start_codon:yes stop_codon:yes gene_type:complete